MNADNTLCLNPGTLWLDDTFLSQPEANDYFEVLLNEIDWQQGSIKLFGKTRVIPRLQAFMADPGLRYSYSGKTLSTNTWHPKVQQLANRIEQYTGTRFNAVLLNLYRDGNDSMGWHRDDEPELGDDPHIASLSLGTARTFMLRRKKRNKGERSLQLDLNHGALLYMGSGVQQHWQHSLPKASHCPRARINLTFRQIITGSDKSDYN